MASIHSFHRRCCSYFFGGIPCCFLLAMLDCTRCARWFFPLCLLVLFIIFLIFCLMTICNCENFICRILFLSRRISRYVLAVTFSDVSVTIFLHCYWKFVDVDMIVASPKLFRFSDEAAVKCSRHDLPLESTHGVFHTMFAILYSPLGKTSSPSPHLLRFTRSCAFYFYTQKDYKYALASCTLSFYIYVRKLYAGSLEY